MDSLLHAALGIHEGGVCCAAGWQHWALHHLAAVWLLSHDLLSCFCLGEPFLLEWSVTGFDGTEPGCRQCLLLCMLATSCCSCVQLLPHTGQRSAVPQHIMLGVETVCCLGWHHVGVYWHKSFCLQYLYPVICPNSHACLLSALLLSAVAVASCGEPHNSMSEPAGVSR